MDDQLEPDDVDRQIEQRVARQRNQRGGHDQGDVDHEEIGEAPLEVAEELPALGDRADDGAEVVVEQHDRGDLAGAARAALAHRDADVRGLQRRHVVHAVAGDRDDLARRLERPARAPASAPAPRARSRPRRRGRAARGAVEARLHLVRETIAGIGSPSPISRGDGACGDRMIAGHHDRADARLAAGARPPPRRPRAPGPRRRAARRSEAAIAARRRPSRRRRSAARRRR